MSKQSRKELLEVLRPKYLSASSEEKTELINVFVEATGYHRKYVISLLSAESQPGKLKRRVVVYNEDVRKALVFAWDVSNHLCSKRLVAFLPELVEILERTEHLHINAHTRELLLQISAATIDRILKPIRRTASHSRSFTKPGGLLKKQIPLRTFTDWDDAIPGFFEADLVSHSGPDPSGQFLQTLTLTDICTQWTECFSLLRRGELEVRMALQGRERLLPFDFKGLDTDNGFEFINWEMLNWCKIREITFTRGRPYKKNDQAHVEERNGAIVRKLVGYDRLEGRIAQRTLSEFYDLVRLYQNFFQPSQKLQVKHRNGARVYRKHDEARTPYRRVLESVDIPEHRKQALMEQYKTLDPVKLIEQIRQMQSQLQALAVPSVFPKSKRANRRKSKPSLEANLQMPQNSKEKPKIREVVESLPPGCIIHIPDFFEYGCRKAIESCFRQLTSKNKLERIGWGEYRIPGEQKEIVPLVSKKIDEATDALG